MTADAISNRTLAMSVLIMEAPHPVIMLRLANHFRPAAAPPLVVHQAVVAHHQVVAVVVPQVAAAGVHPIVVDAMVAISRECRVVITMLSVASAIKLVVIHNPPDAPPLPAIHHVPAHIAVRAMVAAEAALARITSGPIAPALPSPTIVQHPIPALAHPHQLKRAPAPSPDMCMTPPTTAFVPQVSPVWESVDESSPLLAVPSPTSLLLILMVIIPLVSAAHQPIPLILIRAVNLFPRRN